MACFLLNDLHDQRMKNKRIKIRKDIDCISQTIDYGQTVLGYAIPQM